MKKILIVCFLSATIASASENISLNKNLNKVFVEIIKGLKRKDDTTFYKSLADDVYKLPRIEEILQKTIPGFNEKMIETKEYNDYCKNRYDITHDTRAILIKNLHEDELL